MHNFHEYYSIMYTTLKYERQQSQCHIIFLLLSLKIKVIKDIRASLFGYRLVQNWRKGRWVYPIIQFALIAGTCQDLSELVDRYRVQMPRTILTEQLPKSFIIHLKLNSISYINQTLIYCSYYNRSFQLLCFLAVITVTMAMAMKGIESRAYSARPTGSGWRRDCERRVGCLLGTAG